MKRDIPTFKNSLFAVNQSLMFTSSLFATGKSCLISLLLKKRLLSSANIIVPNKRDAFGRLLTYTRNKNGPRKYPWGMPQVTYLGSTISTYMNVLFSIK